MPDIHTDAPGVNTRLRTALHYAARGWSIFPVVPNRKEPLIEAWQKLASTDPGQIKEWAEQFPDCNWAVATDLSGVGVVDLDGGWEGVENWAEIAHGQDTPDTLTHRTPRNGLHYIFAGKLPQTTGAATYRKKLANKIDTKGGYILLPASRTADGAYTVERDLPLAPLPAWIQARLDACPKASARLEVNGIEADLDHNVDRAIQYLKNLAPVRQGEGADAATLQAAMKLHDLGLSAENSVELMLAHYDCQPQGEKYAAFIERKVENAAKYATNTFGVDAIGQPASVTFHAEAMELLKHLAENPVEWVSFADLLKVTVAPVRELIPGLVEKGILTFLAGPGGVHKSRLGLQWGLCLAAGLPVFGRSTERCSFVFVSYEDHQDEVIRRTQAIASRLNIPAADILANTFYLDMRGKPALLEVSTEDGVKLTPFGQRFQADLKALPGHKFVVYDSSYNAAAFSGQAKIDEPSVKAAIETMGQQFCDACDATGLALWHPSQSGLERDDASGWSVAWVNTPRARLSLAAGKKDPDVFNLSVVKRNNARKAAPVALHYQDGILAPLTAVDLVKQDAVLIGAVVRFATSAAANGQPITKQGRWSHDWVIDEVEKVTGQRLSERRLRDALELAASAGLLHYRHCKRQGDPPTGYHPFAETGQDTEEEGETH